jgi:hypothetical protein
MSNNNFNNIINSSIATACAEILTMPICTIKTNYQNVYNMKDNPSILNISKYIYNRGCIKSFYAASLPSISGQVFSTMSKYTLYRYFDSNPEYPIKNKFLNGMTAGIITSTITHPLDVFKVHLQMDKKININFKNLYKGYSKTFIKIVISSSIFFPMYDTVKQKINNPIIASSISAIIATFIMHPVDYLKVRHMSGLPLYDGYNPKTYYRGLTINLLRIVPHFVITMQIIELLDKKIEKILLKTN